MQGKMRNYLIVGFLFLIIAVAGCSGSSRSGSGTGSGEAKLVQITPEEWQLISEAGTYCNALDDLGLTNEEVANRVSECQKDQLSSSLWGKYQKYMSPEQQQLRSEVVKGAEAKERQEIEKNYNLSIGITAVIPSFKREITLLSIDIPQDKSGLLVKVKIRNLGKLPLTVTFDDEFSAIDFEGNYYWASNPVKTTVIYPPKMVVKVQPDEEVTKDVLFKLDPEKVKVESIRYGIGGKVLATWI